MFKLIKFLKGYTVQVIAAPLFKLIEALFELIIPIVVAKIIDVGIPAGDTSYIIKMSFVLVALGAGGFCFSIVCQFLAAKSSLGYGTNLRRALFGHINKFGYAELDRFGAPGLVTRLTNDINQTQVGVAMFLRLVLRSPFIAAGSIIMAMTIDLKLSLIFIAMAALVSLVLYITMSRSMPFYRSIQSKLDNIAMLTRENLSGARVVRAFSNQEEEQRDFKEAAGSLSKKSRRVGAISGLINPLTYALVNLAIILVLYFGGKEVYAGRLTQGQILALVNYLSQILLSLVVLANLIVTFTKSSACAKRINEVLQTVPAVTETAVSHVVAIEGAPKIEFKNVGFSYAGNAGNALEDISFSIRAGGTFGIIGPTGSGKSTIVSLLGRHYDVKSGEAEVDGVNVRHYPFKQLREKIGLVPQKAVLFSGTVRENLLMGRTDISDDELYFALKTAMAYEFVMTLEKGLDTPVLREGRNFSGGQKQRLTIARALAKRPEILILDDSSSALDYATDYNLRKNLRSVPYIMTVVIVSQRATSIKDADAILVLDEGKCAGIGTHGELLQSCALYKEICSSQGRAEGEGGNEN